MDIGIKTYLKILQHYKFNIKAYRHFYKLKKVVMDFHRNGATYSISSRCNLQCVGCFFESPHYQEHKTMPSMAEYKEFLTKQRKDVKWAVLSGAEPSLEMERIKIAAEMFDHIVIYSNGIIRIPESIENCTIIVSSWGDSDLDKKTRKNSNFDLSLKNYAHDKRVRFLYTFNSQNIDDVFEVAQKIKDNGLLLSFNHHCDIDEMDNDFDVLTREDLAKIHKKTTEVIKKYPDNILYTEYISEWATKDVIFDIDPETNLARDCPFMNGHKFKIHYNDFTVAECCMPMFKCNECRANIVIFTLIADLRNLHLSDKNLMNEWLDAIITYIKFSFSDKYYDEMKEILEPLYLKV